jgi:methylmalonyl-CoA/ethylmalonyl-CoA epimerase
VQLGRLDHVGVAVTDLAAARALYEQVLGLEVTHEEVIEEQGVHELLLRAGDAFVQLVAPLSPDSPVGRFLAKRGEGLHHVGYAVPEVAAAVADLRTRGFEVIDPAPRIGSGGTTIAFLHPKSMQGVLVELVEEGTGPRTGASRQAQMRAEILGGLGEDSPKRTRDDAKPSQADPERLQTESEGGRSRSSPAPLASSAPVGGTRALA